MPFNAEKFLRDFNIQYVTSGNKHCRPGWAQVHCPFCTGSRDFHLGINVRYAYGNCYRCGWKSLDNIIMSLLTCRRPEAKKILCQYSAKTRGTSNYPPDGAVPGGGAEKVEYPMGTGPMNSRHKLYLEKRGFDPEMLEREYGLLGTGPVGQYRHRIILPIVFDGQVVSYQGRDITDRSELKYMACPMSGEIVNHKNILYNMDQVPGNAVVVVEGVTDAWRLGAGAVATFGTSYKASQVKLLNDTFEEFFILFDAEPEAQRRARELGHQLALAGGQVEILTIGEAGMDPGQLSDGDAHNLMHELIGG